MFKEFEDCPDCEVERLDPDRNDNLRWRMYLCDRHKLRENADDD